MVAILAAHESNVDGVKAALEPWVRDAESQEEKKAREAQLHYWLIRAGAEKELEELRSLADANPQIAEPALYLSMALEEHGELLEAAHELERRIGSLPQPEQARVKLRQARMLRLAGMFDEAEKCARSVAGLEGITQATRAEAFAQTAWAVEELGRKLESLGLFERSIELDPTQTSIRFHLAFEYGAEGLRELAIVHYEALVNRQGDSGAKNNLGIKYGELNLPVSSIRRLKEAAEDGLSLAAGNLATMLAASGFADEAQIWIEKGRSVSDVSARVEEAAHLLLAKPDEESRALKDIRKRGRDLRQIFRLISEPQAKLPEGTWYMSTGHQVTFAIKDGTSTGSFGEGVAKVRIDFVLTGGQITFKWSSGEYGFQSWTGAVNCPGFSGGCILWEDVAHGSIEAADAEARIGTPAPA